MTCPECNRRISRCGYEHREGCSKINEHEELLERLRLEDLKEDTTHGDED